MDFMPEVKMVKAAFAGTSLISRLPVFGTTEPFLLVWPQTYPNDQFRLP